MVRRTASSIPRGIANSSLNQRSISFQISKPAFQPDNLALVGRPDVVTILAIERELFEALARRMQRRAAFRATKRVLACEEDFALSSTAISQLVQ